MPAPVIAFETAVVARRADDEAGLAIALLDGSGDAASSDAPETCVAILLCSDATAQGLAAALGSALQAPEAPQSSQN